MKSKVLKRVIVFLIIFIVFFFSINTIKFIKISNENINYFKESPHSTEETEKFIEAVTATYKPIKQWRLYFKEHTYRNGANLDYYGVIPISFYLLPMLASFLAFSILELLFYYKRPNNREKTIKYIKNKFIKFKSNTTNAKVKQLEERIKQLEKQKVGTALVPFLILKPIRKEKR